MVKETNHVGPSPEEIDQVSTPPVPGVDGPGRTVLVCVAWPYANGHLHLGHIAGSLLPPDIFARFQRMQGNRVLMVSGSDCHGTPIMLTAEKEGKAPSEVVDHYNAEHIKAIRDFGIAFDIFTKTTTENHERNVQDIFTTLLDQGYLEKRTTEAPYDPGAGRFLPDRYVEGTCPHCGYTDARGDQCDDCGKTLDAHELIDPHPKGAPDGRIEFRPTEHFFFLLSRFQKRLEEYVADKQPHWRPNTKNFTNNWLKEGLQDRPITRDLTWGVPIPLDGFEDKRLYVWFEAVCGYYTSAIEWAERVGKPDAWRTWWESPETESVYFLGKDNIPFHTIIWPSILMGFSDGREARGEKRLVLPYDVPANEFLNLDGKQFSKSRGIGIWVPDVLGRFDPDVVRYYLSVNMPENRDANWTWEDFVAKVNDELVDSFGNLVHRALTFTEKNFGAVPEPGTLGPDEERLVARIRDVHAEVTDDLAHSRFKKALRTIMGLASEGNRYFAASEPWRLVKEDKERAATVLHTSMFLVRSLCLMLAPYIPFATHRLWKYLGEEGAVHATAWVAALEPPTVGMKLSVPEVLFRKLDLKEILQPEAPESSAPQKKKEKPKMPTAETTNNEVTIDEFAKLDLRIATVKSVEDHPDADRLYVIKLDVGDLGERQVCAGLKKFYAPDEMVGKKVAFIANLKPAVLRGVESQGMILAGDSGDAVAFLTPEKELPAGAKIR
ncbi:MAG: methionine--tRNA ligase [Euryarchaeota archaeon]|nr:methionine--tRNA ligase [Euryarchaeota archaeon]